MISRPAWLVRQELCLGLPVPCSLINMRKGIPVSGITADASLPTSAAPFLRILHEDGVVPPGLGLKSGRLPSAEQLAEKVVEGARSTPQARTHFQRLNGTTEVVPFPKPVRVRVFPQVVKRRHIFQRANGTSKLACFPNPAWIRVVPQPPSVVSRKFAT